jgi:hypothetical protein
MSQATFGVASKRVAARYDVIAVITRTTTILGFETSIKSRAVTAKDASKVF